MLRTNRRPFLAFFALGLGASLAAVALRPAHARSRPRVSVFMTAWCRACQQHMRGLDRLGIDYRAIDIEKDPGPYEPVRRKLGRAAIPVTIVKLGADQRWIVGNDSSGVERAVRELAE